MTKPDWSKEILDEMTNAIQQTIQLEQTKAKTEVLRMVNTGLESGKTTTAILASILDWATKPWK